MDLELRTPFVDRKLFDSVTQIPAGFRLRKSKKLLLEAVPEDPDLDSECAKAGISLPFELWVKEHWKQRFSDIDRSSPFA